MDYREPILLSLANVTPSVWDTTSAQRTIDAIMERASFGPVRCEEAINIFHILPAFVLFDTRPLTYRDNGPGPSSFGIHLDEGVASSYWFSTQFSVADETFGALVVFLVQVRIGSCVHGVSAWALYGGCALNGAWHSFAPVYLDSGAVHVGAHGVEVSCLATKLSIHVTKQTFAVTFSDTSVTNGLRYSIWATSARGPVYQQPRGSYTISGGFQQAYWSVVDGLAQGNLCMPGGTDVSFTNAMAWLDCQQAGLVKLSKLDLFLQSLTGGTLTAPPWMCLTIQQDDTQISAYFTGMDKIRALQRGEAVKAGSVTVWKTGQPSANFNFTGTAKVLEVYSHTNVPSKVSLTIHGNVLILKSCVDRTSGHPPLLPTSISNIFCSPTGVELDGVPSANARGTIEWRDETFSVKEILGRTKVSRSFLGALNPSTLAITVMSFVSATFLLLLLVTAWAMFKSCTQRRKGRNT